MKIININAIKGNFANVTFVPCKVRVIDALQTCYHPNKVAAKITVVFSICIVSLSLLLVAAPFNCNALRQCMHFTQTNFSIFFPSGLFIYDS